MNSLQANDHPTPATLPAKPRLLLFVNTIPFPPSRDGNIVVVHRLITHLAADYSIDLVFPVFRDDEESRAEIDAIRPLCNRVVAFPFTSSMTWRLAIAAFHPGTLISFLYPRSIIRRRVLALLADRTGTYDAILLQDRKMATAIDLFDPEHKARRILIGIDYLTLHFERLAATTSAWWRLPYFALTARRLARHEPRSFRTFDAIALVSDIDRDELLRRHPEFRDRTTAIPMALDLPAPVTSQSQQPDAATLLFVGNMNYEPNRQAVSWFAQYVLPRLRQDRAGLKWLIVGYGANAHVRIDHPAVEIHDSVADVAPFMRRATVVVSPLQSGTGIKNKVIEAMAAETPVVGTALSFDGIGAVHGLHAMISDDPAQTAGHIEQLFDDVTLRKRMGSAARNLVQPKFDTAVVMQRWRALIRGELRSAETCT